MMASPPTIPVASSAPNPDVPLPQQAPTPSLVVPVPSATVSQQPQQSHNDLFSHLPDCLHQVLQLVLANAVGDFLASAPSTAVVPRASLLDGSLISSMNSSECGYGSPCLGKRG